MNDALIRLLLILMAATTAVTGLAQLVAPAWVLAFIAPKPDALAAHFFATVGMFMVITGAMFLQSLLRRSPEPAIPFWIGVQKGAAAVWWHGRSFADCSPPSPTRWPRSMRSPP